MIDYIIIQPYCTVHLYIHNVKFKRPNFNTILIYREPGSIFHSSKSRYKISISLGLIPAPFQARLLSSTSEVEIVNGLDSLPPLNRATLCLLFNFLRMVANTTENRMSASALAVCIGPSLFRVPINTEGLETQNRANEIAHKFIKNYSTFFKRSSSDVPDQNDNCPKVSRYINWYICCNEFC